MTKNTQFKTLLNTWLNQKKPMITPSTHASFTLIAENHLIPYFGKRKIGSITEADIQSYITYLHNSGRLDNTGGLTVKTIRDVILVLRLAMEYAYKERAIPLLNWDLIEYPKELGVKKVNSLSKDQEQTLIQCIYMDLNRKTAGILIALFTGVRIGEGSALMTSIEGKRGEPRPKPPRSAVKGLWKKPTVLNNVETYANVPQIILKGADWFAGIGTEGSKGTKVFALGGKINNIGLVEVPMGTTLRDIIFDIGGGIPNGKSFKAAQTGGPSGGCIPAEHLDTPIDYDTLTKLGSMIGSGGLIVMDENTCMVDLAKFFLEFTVDESCGKCNPCRIGTKRMLEILTRITEGKGTPEDIDKLEILARNIKAASLCGLGQSAPNPVLSTLRYFRDEYMAHVIEKKCPAGVCKSMLKFKIDTEVCKKCGICKKNCPVSAISGDKEHPFVIDQDKCVKCGVCIEKCPFKSILKNA